MNYGKCYEGNELDIMKENSRRLIGVSKEVLEKL